MPPRATYRLQVHGGFDFDAAAGVVPYVARLGVSHLYLSPVLQAAPGSTHGYDVVDHRRLSDELGGRSGFDRLSRAAAEHDLSLVLDIVPNHMALAGAANRWWWDVLEDGPASEHATAFDIDWEAGPADGPSVLMPVLGDHVGRVIERGELSLARIGGAFVLRYAEHELPLSPSTTAPFVRSAAATAKSDALDDLADRLEVAAPQTKAAIAHDLRAVAAAEPAVAEALDAELGAITADPDALDALLGRQHYRLAHWRVASDELDYRRFFDITSLVGLRVERDDVFDAIHGLVLELIEGGEVTGLRVDHVDGLRDPARYLERLRQAAPHTWIVVEKILADGEDLEAAWPVDGTTGYEFVRAVGDLFVDPAGAEHLQRHHDDVTGTSTGFDDVVHEAKGRVLGRELAAEVERVTDLAVAMCRSRRRHRDHTRRELRRTVAELAAAFDVYRTYVAPGRPVSSTDRTHIEAALAVTRDRNPDLDGELLDLLGRVLALEEPGTEELAVRFQQLSAPAMAKGLEDTAFYRWVPLLGANEVGGHPGHVGRGPAPFHARNASVAARRPDTMLAVSTHDTKRSADVRARLAVLTEVAGAWTATVDRWRIRNAEHRGDWDDPAMELVLYQSMVGAWPVTADRLEPVLVKSANEAKVHTSWRDPDDAYLVGLLAFVGAVADDAAFTAEVEAFLTEHDIVHRGRLLSLAQVTLELTSPGVPDTYQGDELWDLSLVDPDNRRLVDFARRATLLEEIADAGPEAALARAEEGAPKQWLLHRLLHHRRAVPELYRSPTYRPLEVDGRRADAVVAFTRGDLAVVVPSRTDVSGWDGTTVSLPPGDWSDVLGEGAVTGGDIAVERLVAHFPVSVLERRRR